MLQSKKSTVWKMQGHVRLRNSPSVILAALHTLAIVQHSCNHLARNAAELDAANGEQVVGPFNRTSARRKQEPDPSDSATSLTPWFSKKCRDAMAQVTSFYEAERDRYSQNLRSGITWEGVVNFCVGNEKYEKCFPNGVEVGLPEVVKLLENLNKEFHIRKLSFDSPLLTFAKIAAVVEMVRLAKRLFPTVKLTLPDLNADFSWAADVMNWCQQTATWFPEKATEVDAAVADMQKVFDEGRKLRADVNAKYVTPPKSSSSRRSSNSGRSSSSSSSSGIQSAASIDRPSSSSSSSSSGIQSAASIDRPSSSSTRSCTMGNTAAQTGEQQFRGHTRLVLAWYVKERGNAIAALMRVYEAMAKKRSHAFVSWDAFLNYCVRRETDEEALVYKKCFPDGVKVGLHEIVTLFEDLNEMGLETRSKQLNQLAEFLKVAAVVETIRCAKRMFSEELETPDISCGFEWLQDILPKFEETLAPTDPLIADIRKVIDEAKKWGTIAPSYNSDEDVSPDGRSSNTKSTVRGSDNNVKHSLSFELPEQSPRETLLLDLSKAIAAALSASQRNRRPLLEFLRKVPDGYLRSMMKKRSEELACKSDVTENEERLIQICDDLHIWCPALAARIGEVLAKPRSRKARQLQDAFTDYYVKVEAAVSAVKHLPSTESLLKLHNELLGALSQSDDETMKSIACVANVRDSSSAFKNDKRLSHLVAHNALYKMWFEEVEWLIRSKKFRGKKKDEMLAFAKFYSEEDILRRSLLGLRADLRESEAEELQAIIDFFYMNEVKDVVQLCERDKKLHEKEHLETWANFVSRLEFWCTGSRMELEIKNITSRFRCVLDGGRHFPRDGGVKRIWRRAKSFVRRNFARKWNAPTGVTLGSKKVSFVTRTSRKSPNASHSSGENGAATQKNISFRKSPNTSHSSGENGAATQKNIFRKSPNASHSSGENGAATQKNISFAAQASSKLGKFSRKAAKQTRESNNAATGNSKWSRLPMMPKTLIQTLTEKCVLASRTPLFHDAALA